MVHHRSSPSVDLLPLGTSGYGSGSGGYGSGGHGGGGCGCMGMSQVDLGMLAAGAAAFFALYTAATMMTRRRRRRSEAGSGGGADLGGERPFPGNVVDVILKGRTELSFLRIQAGDA